MSDAGAATQTFTVFGSWFDGHKDTRPKPFEMPWPEFVEAVIGMFRAREDKFADDAPGFSLARFVERDGEVRRRNVHVDALSGIVLDFDKDYSPEAVFERLDGAAWFAYTTFGHAPDKPRWRVVVPLATPIPGPHYKRVRAWLLNRINSHTPAAPGRAIGDNKADEQAKALSNFFFGPGCPEAQSEYADWRFSDGPPIEVPPIESFARVMPETRILGPTIDWSFIHAKMKTHKDPILRAAFRQVLKGRSFANHGARDSTLLRMCGALAGWALACEPSALAEIFKKSLDAMVLDAPDDPPPDVDNAADKIARAQASMLAQAKAENSFHAGEAQAVYVEEPVDDEVATAWANGVGLATADDLRRRLLLMNHQDLLWVWRPEDADWSGPFKAQAAQTAARADLARVPGVDVWARKADGGLRLKVTPELLHDHGEIVDTVRMRLGLRRSAYDPARRTLTLPGAPMRELEPAFDAFVDRWLRAMGGADADKLLDWIAGLTKHERPNSVLFVRSAPGIGKSLLARGLARVWEVDDAVDLDKISGQFDADLVRCPLVQISEGKKYQNQDVTTMLRKLTTQASRSVNRKHVDHIELVGHLRFIVTANNFNIFANDQHALTPEDRDAIAERFLEIQSAPAAHRVLEEIPYEERNALADKNVIAAHALWLAENRQLNTHSRFIVPGDRAGRFATKIITEDHRFGSWVVEWLARYLSDPSSVEKGQGHLVSRGVDPETGTARVLVSPEAIINTFETVLKNKQRPQTVEISNALCSLSTGPIAKLPNGKASGFEILVEEVAAWSEEKGVGNSTLIRANARAPRVVGAIAETKRVTKPETKGAADVR